MAINLDTLSHKELGELITSAESHIKASRAGAIKAVRSKIEALLSTNGLTLTDVFSTRSARGGKKGTVAPKYQNPSNAAQTWSGRGKRPRWFVDALKGRGVSADSLLIEKAAKSSIFAKVPKSAKVASKKRSTKKASKKTSRK